MPEHTVEQHHCTEDIDTNLRNLVALIPGPGSWKSARLADSSSSETLRRPRILLYTDITARGNLTIRWAPLGADERFREAGLDRDGNNISDFTDNVVRAWHATRGLTGSHARPLGELVWIHPRLLEEVDEQPSLSRHFGRVLEESLFAIATFFDPHVISWYVRDPGDGVWNVRHFEERVAANDASALVEAIPQARYRTAGRKYLSHTVYDPTQKSA